jgi:hypothetical protein
LPSRLAFGTVDLPHTAVAGRVLDRFYDGVYAKACHPPHCTPELVATVRAANA